MSRLILLNRHITVLFHSFLPFITTPNRITRNTKTVIDNIFYNKRLNYFMSGNLSRIISNHLIQYLIEPSKFTKKSPQMVYRQICYKSFDKLYFRADLIRVSWTVCYDPDPNSALEHFLKIVQKLLDKHGLHLDWPILLKSKINFAKVSARKKFQTKKKIMKDNWKHTIILYLHYLGRQKNLITNDTD